MTVREFNPTQNCWEIVSVTRITPYGTIVTTYP